MTLRRIGAVVREAWFSALAAPVASVLTMAMVAGMCVAVLVTAGRTQAAEAAALSRIDAVGTRSVVLRMSDGAGVDSDVVARLSQIEEVADVSALGAVFDVRNASLDDGTPVAARLAFGNLGEGLSPGDMRASPLTLERLGLVDGVGAVRSRDQWVYAVVGPLDVPEHLAAFEPLAVVGAGTDAHPVSLVVILVDAPEDVAAVVRVLPAVLDADDPTKVGIETSEELAQVRAAVAGELGAYGHSTVLAILGVTGLLLGVNLFAMVMMRRRDFGRRRALGASQGLIVGLLLTQTLVLASMAAAASSGLTVLWLSLNRQPLPEPAFVLAVVLSAVVTAGVAAVIPAAVAARREPLNELRVP